MLYFFEVMATHLRVARFRPESAGMVKWTLKQSKWATKVERHTK